MELYAFDINSNLEWEALRQKNTRIPTLTLPCCGSRRVLLRTSKLGTRHFVHARRIGCNSPPETPEHLLAKERIAIGIRRAGWAAKVEEKGTTSNGELWVADALAVREGNPTHAFEVQWSQQSIPETQARQSRYKSAKISGLWLFRQHEFQSDESVPAFRLDFDKTSREFNVLIPSYKDDLSNDRRRSKYSPFWCQTVELSAFVQGVLTGRLYFAPALKRKFDIEMSAASILCNACGQRTRILLELRFKISKDLPNFPDISLPIYNLPKNSKTIEQLSFLVPDGVLQHYGIGKLQFKTRFGILNSCVRCHQLIDNSHPLREINLAQPIFQCSGFLNPDWLSRQELSEMHRWWFDESRPLHDPVTLK